MIADYFEFLKRLASSDPSVKKLRLVQERIGVETGYLRFVLELTDGSELHVFEFVNSSTRNVRLITPIIGRIRSRNWS